MSSFAYVPETWTPCQTTSPDLWFPDNGGSADAQKAKTLCRTDCPERAFNACLKFALDNYVEGIWAGTSERERRRLKKGRVA